MKHNIGECYLCGKNAVLTADHVPAKGFFPKPIPNEVNLITVYACASCNTFWGPKETKVIHDLSIIGSSPDAHKVFTMSTRANYMRHFYERGMVPSKEFFEIKSRLINTNISTPTGILLPEKEYHLKMPNTHDDVFIKIAKGLHRHHALKRLADDVDVQCYKHVVRYHEHFHDLIHLANISEVIGQTFSYRGALVRDSINVTSFWYMLFYETVEVLVLFSHNTKYEYSQLHRNSST